MKPQRFSHSPSLPFLRNRLLSCNLSCCTERMGQLDQLGWLKHLRWLVLALTKPFRLRFGSRPSVNLERIAKIPTPPPCPAANRSTLSSIQPISISQYAKNKAERPRVIDCIFYPNHESECAFSWTGPDPLSPDTCADDILLYVSAFFLFERVHWIEIRLSKLSPGTEEVVEEYPFFLPRVESMLGNLRRARGQIRDIISRSGYMGSAGETRFQLSLRPQMEIAADPGMRSAIPLSCIHPSLPIASFDPQFFVQNIVRNWGI